MFQKIGVCTAHNTVQPFNSKILRVTLDLSSLYAANLTLCRYCFALYQAKLFYPELKIFTACVQTTVFVIIVSVDNLILLCSRKLFRLDLIRFFLFSGKKRKLIFFTDVLPRTFTLLPLYCVAISHKAFLFPYRNVINKFAFCSLPLFLYKSEHFVRLYCLTTNRRHRPCDTVYLMQDSVNHIFSKWSIKSI